LDDYIPASPARRSHERIILVIVIIVDLIVIGAVFFMLHPQTSTINVMPSPTPTNPMTTQAPTPTSGPPPSLKPTRTPTNVEEDRVRNVLGSYYEALNRHSVEDVVSFFTDNTEILINHGRDYAYHGPKEGIKSYLSTAFLMAPDATITGLDFIKIDINGSRAQVHLRYVVSSKIHDLLRPVDENIELIKQDGFWKISKTDITY